MFIYIYKNHVENRYPQGYSFIIHGYFLILVAIRVLTIGIRMFSNKDLIDIAPIFYGISVVPKKHWESYGYALLIIAGADGKVSPQEMEWLTQELAPAVGIPDEIASAWEMYDHTNASLEHLFEMLRPGTTANFARLFIYDAIRMASADHNYADKERDIVSKTARILQVPQEVILTIEALVDLEKAAEKIRMTLF
jgi:uncharacterized tellurite resistance protein B-like protein